MHARGETTEALEAYDTLTQTLLMRRGIATREQAERFFAPNYDEDIRDPYLLSDMERAVARILSAIEQQEHIVIFSDYDTDGIPGAVVLSDFFKKIEYENVRVYIPHRVLEGFGMNVEAVEEVANDGATLIITIDCGSADTKPIARASELGIDVIVTDHHHVPTPAPSAYALVNPKVEGSRYPNKDICGAGVAFQLVRALLQSPYKGAPSLRDHFSIKEGWEKWLLDMVGIATLSDRVPLMGENRALAYFGLMVLRKSPRAGIRALCQRLKVAQNTCDEADVGFAFGPRINAASRMGHPEDAFELLSTTERARADELARKLDLLNTKRKGSAGAMVREIKKRLRAREVGSVVVLGDPAWKPSLLGLVAGTLAQEYERPVFLWGREDGTVIKGSCRSDGSVSVIALMERAQDTLLEHGGHEFSGGFSVSSEKIHTLEAALNEAYEGCTRIVVSRELAPDAEATLGDVGRNFLRATASFRPFGEGNPQPLLSISPVTVVDVSQFGKHEEHVRVVVRDREGAKREAIAFFTKPSAFSTLPGIGSEVCLMGSAEESNFRGRSEIRLRIADILPL